LINLQCTPGQILPKIRKRILASNFHTNLYMSSMQRLLITLLEHASEWHLRLHVAAATPLRDVMMGFGTAQRSCSSFDSFDPRPPSSSASG
jgi:hypothetical protein